MLIQYDLQEVVGRLNSRMEEALRLFGQKRTRDHFKGIFFSRYKEFSVQTIQDLDEEIYPQIISIYEEIDSTYWYLMSTEDMPSMVKTNINSSLKNINKKFSNIIDYFVSDLGLEKKSQLGEDQSTFDQLEKSEDFEEVPPPFNDIEIENDDI